MRNRGPPLLGTANIELPDGTAHPEEGLARNPMVENHQEEDEDVWDFVVEPLEPGPGIDQGPVPEKIAKLEEHWLKQVRKQRCLHKDAGFSLAFSGGGVRAAAFQAGVLWRLAQEGQLKYLDYLTAVSGGGYVAASFLSHILGSTELGNETTMRTTNPEELDRHYRRVVARTLCRMQQFAGNFVRDCVANPWRPAQGGGLCPQFCDVPILVLMLILTILSNPFMYFVTALAPAAEMIDIYYGSGMRGSFCAPRNEGTVRGTLHVLWNYSPLPTLSMVICGLIFGTFIVWAANLFLSCFRSRQEERAEKCAWGARVSDALVQYLARVVLIFLLLEVVIIASALGQRARWELSEVKPMRHVACATYTCRLVQNATRIPSYQLEACCAGPNAWYRQDTFWMGFNCSDPNIADVLARNASAAQQQDSGFSEDISLSWVVTVLMVSIVCFSVVLLPVIPSLLHVWAGPLLALLLVIVLVENRVYRNLDAVLQIRDDLEINARFWHNIIGASVFFAFASVPLESRSMWHYYYRRCLRKTFFDKGKDFRWKEVRDNPYCPFLILTGTVNDYMRPGDDDSLSEISISPLHTGSNKCGYVHTPGYRSLAMSTALSAAGCLDALSLSMINQLRARFWLEVLNLGWGHYLLFKPWGCATRMQRRLGSLASREKGWIWLYHRLPSVVVWSCILLLAVAGWENLRDEPIYCSRGKALVMISITLALITLGLGFFSFIPGTDFAMFSSPVRTIQQVTQHFASGQHPPGMVKVTDGGVKDCTALLQLMKRRCRRILLVLAAMDPNDDFEVLRKAMEGATAGKLGSFFDPKERGRNALILLDIFKKDPSMPFLHIGIRYGWEGDAESGGSKEATGDLFVLKNRLPPDMADWEMPSPLTSEEIEGEFFTSFNNENWGDLRPADLGGCGCCDCCHVCTCCRRRICNIGPKFPHLSAAGYLFLSPQLFNCLCRLGHNISADVVQAMTAS